MMSWKLMIVGQQKQMIKDQTFGVIPMMMMMMMMMK